MNPPGKSWLFGSGKGHVAHDRVFNLGTNAKKIASGGNCVNIVRGPESKMEIPSTIDHRLEAKMEILVKQCIDDGGVPSVESCGGFRNLSMWTFYLRQLENRSSAVETFSQAEVRSRTRQRPEIRRGGRLIGKITEDRE